MKLLSSVFDPVVGLKYIFICTVEITSITIENTAECTNKHLWLAKICIYIYIFKGGFAQVCQVRGITSSKDT